jgi:hypothetical protein
MHGCHAIPTGRMTEICTLGLGVDAAGGFLVRSETDTAVLMKKPGSLTA